MSIKERYTPIKIAANGTATLTGDQIAGFLCTVSGTLNATDFNGTNFISALPVTAGVYYPLPFYLGGYGGLATVVLSGGAAGTLGV